MVHTCEVALPLPLRNTFTYSVPDALDESTVTGARVVVPFRNRAMLGVVLGRGESSDGASLRNVTEILDPLPALSSRLVELGRWISNYYLSPIGETLRVMLPPSVEIQFDREWRISETGRLRLEELQSIEIPSEAESAERSLLQLIAAGGGVASDGILRSLRDGPAIASRLLRRNELTIQAAGRRRKARVRNVLIWRDGAFADPSRPAEQKIHRVLAESTGPLPLPSVLNLAGVSRSVVQRLVKQGKLIM